MILKINCGLFLTAIFRLVYHAEPVSSEPTFLNDSRSGILELREGETIELPCNYKGSYKKKDYPDEIEITWKKTEGSRLKGGGLFGINTVRNIWFLSPLVPSKRENLVLLSLYIF